jgi:RimJ/RimL family protein N-acetyltransferase
MAIIARVCHMLEIEGLREKYRQEMNCQIIHDSIHGRPGWTREFSLQTEDGPVIGYGCLLQSCGAKIIETQSNAPVLPVMLHVFGRNLRTEYVLFEHAYETSFRPQAASVRMATISDAAFLRRFGWNESAGWVVTVNGEIAGAGGIAYHYNRPYGDVYLRIGKAFRRLGLGTYLVQELKAACRKGGSVPSARCSVDNLPSLRMLQKAGFVPCGALVAGDLDYPRNDDMLNPLLQE